MDNEKSRRLEIIDGILSKGKPVSFNEIAKELDQEFKKAKGKGYMLAGKYNNNFRKDMCFIRDVLKNNIYGISPNMLMTDGNNRTKRYWYAEPGFSIMPLVDYTYTINDYKALDKSLSIMEATLPKEVFENIEFNLKSRIEYEFSRENKGIDYGENLSLKGRHRLPMLYKSLNKTVLKIKYKPYTFSNPFSFNLHPYLLKQYNNRWFLFGKKVDIGNKSLDKPLSISDYYWNVPIDRIENIVEQKDIVFEPKPDNYLEHFNNIIGVTYKMFDYDLTFKPYSDDRQDGIKKTINETNIQPSTIFIGVHDKKTWGSINTKPLHKSLTIVEDFDEDKKFGNISFNVIPNFDFYLEVLKLGPGVEIIEPLSVREQMKKIVNQMSERYI